MERSGVIGLNLSKIGNTATSQGKAEVGLAPAPVAAKFDLSSTPQIKSKKRFQ